MRISDWSSDVCSSDLVHDQASRTEGRQVLGAQVGQRGVRVLQRAVDDDVALGQERCQGHLPGVGEDLAQRRSVGVVLERSEERRVGKEWVSTCRYRCSPCHSKKQMTYNEKSNI